MTKKRTQPVVRTFKPMPPEPEAESTPAGHTVTITNLMTVSGISREQAEEMVSLPPIPDSKWMQQYYGITAQAAEAVIKVFYG